MQGLETPAGLYKIQDKQVNPSWHVPNSPWAGKLAGKVIPPGPDDPIKARWMGFNGGAGIHGTAEVGSLGSAASHGCVRMAIPDVEELYDQVDVGTPVYVA
jgi:lipoprotein-anchoring transpeptidase ErfK/SrfK